jgi:hypothetical protein
MPHRLGRRLARIADGLIVSALFVMTFVLLLASVVASTGR